MSEIKKSNEDIFLYEVHPKRVITGIPGIPAIRVRKSVYLTKDDVIKCLEKGSVYRRFSLKTERVTTANLDRVHREEYISEEDWPDFLVKLKAEGNGQVVDTTPDNNNTQQVVDTTPETPNTEEDKIGTVQEVTVPEETVTTTEVKENTNTDSTETSEVDAENNSVETDEVSQDEAKSENEEEANNQEENATAVEETAAEQNTENKEKEKKETFKRDQNNINQQQYYSKKNKK